MRLINPVLFSLMCFAVSCGVNESEGVVSGLGKVSDPKDSLQRDVELGLSSASGIRLRSSLTGTRSGLGKAWKSVVSYSDGFNRQCSGFLAYDDVDTVTQMATIYFYTASHCFEKRNGLGFRAQSRIAVTSPRSFPINSLEADAITREISLADPQLFGYSPEVAGDTVRFSQGRVALSQAQTSHHRICQTTTSSNLQAIGYVKGIGLSWANAQNVSLPTVYKSMLAMASNPNNFAVASGVVASPGDSGSPVYAVQRSADGVGVDNYDCVFGIITREFSTPPISNCAGATCNAKGMAVYEILGGMTSNQGIWRPYLPSGYSSP